jgi:hypothetical protein
VTRVLAYRLAAELGCLALLLFGLALLAVPGVGIPWEGIVIAATGAYGTYVHHEAARRLLAQNAVR